MSFMYGYQRTTFIPPQGLHQWRQCVGAAFAMNYYNYNLDITESRVYNHISSGGESDLTIAECPVLYYFVGILYTIFGNDDSLFRIVNVLLLFLGLYYLFKSSNILLKDKFWAIIIPIVIFTSPTLVYYGNSFLPDTSAFGLVLVALFFVVKYVKNPKIKYIYFAALFYAFAGLFKITSQVSFIALISTFILFQIFSSSFRSKYRFRKFILPVLIPFIIVIIWYYFVYYFNTNFGGTISPVAIRPIWVLDQPTITKTWERINNEWLHSYFHLSFQISAGLLLLTCLALYRKSNKFLTILSVITLIGAAGFFLLFFRSFYHHDYYIINLFILIVFILINGLVLVQKQFPGLYRSIIVKIVIALVVSFFAYKVIGKVHYKLTSNYNNLHRQLYHGYVGLEEINRNLGIRPNDLVISIPDNSINISLYLMNQPGFTEYGFFNKKGSDRIDFFISKGAKYLYISDSTVYNNKSYQYLKPYLVKKIAHYKNIDIYDIRMN